MLNIMNFLMFLRGYFRSIENANTISKRTQERKTGEELAVAKPRSTCLISRNLLNVKQPSLVRMLLMSVLGSTGKLARNKDQNPATCSQQRNEDFPGQGSCEKLQRGVENQAEKTKLHFHKTRSHVGLSDFLFERANHFPASRAFLVLSCPSVSHGAL